MIVFDSVLRTFSSKKLDDCYEDLKNKKIRHAFNLNLVKAGRHPNIFMRNFNRYRIEKWRLQGNSESDIYTELNRRRKLADTYGTVGMSFGNKLGYVLYVNSLRSYNYNDLKSGINGVEQY